MNDKIPNIADNGGGISFLGLLTITFIVLKLTNVIAWSWVWVLSPIWIPLSILIAIILVCGITIWVVSK
jgi:hypothetical protein